MKRSVRCRGLKRRINSVVFSNKSEFGFHDVPNFYVVDGSTANHHPLYDVLLLNARTLSIIISKMLSSSKRR